MGLTESAAKAYTVGQQRYFDFCQQTSLVPALRQSTNKCYLLHSWWVRAYPGKPLRATWWQFATLTYGQGSRARTSHSHGYNLCCVASVFGRLHGIGKWFGQLWTSASLVRYNQSTHLCPTYLGMGRWQSSAYLAYMWLPHESLAQVSTVLTSLNT